MAWFLGSEGLIWGLSLAKPVLPWPWNQCSPGPGTVVGCCSARSPWDLGDGLTQGSWDGGQEPGRGTGVETQRPLCIRCQMHFCQMDQSSLGTVRVMGVESLDVEGQW